MCVCEGVNGGGACVGVCVRVSGKEVGEGRGVCVVGCASGQRFIALPLKETHKHFRKNMTPVGFEPTHPKIVELESTALDHSAKVSIHIHGLDVLGDVCVCGRGVRQNNTHAKTKQQ